MNFAWAGFAAAMLSNFAFVFRNIFSKQMQTDIGADSRVPWHRLRQRETSVSHALPVPLLRCADCLAHLRVSRWFCAGLKGINLYAWMSILGTIILLPISLIVEGGQIAAG